jgi:phosphohistidine swiveling domain-containing protein
VTISAVLADVLSTDSDLVTTTVALREDVQKADLNRAAALDERAKLMASAPEFLRTAVRIGDEYGAALADRRKATMLPALDALDRFAKEFARRTSVPYELVAYLGPREVKDFFSNPTAYSDRLASRGEGLVLTQAPFPLENMEMKARIELQGDSVFVPRQDEPTVAEGAAAVEVIKQLDVSMALLKSGEGDVNPRGDIIVKPSGGTKLRGIGRLVTDPRHDEFNRGEILIATSTTPDFMPAIRRAAALVVDMGGALSHAAIASRELGIPCVIGTSVATAIFGNGEEIEIDFESGEITRTGEKGAST